MSEKKIDAPVRLLAPNGMQVTVGESKVEARLAQGYTKPDAKKASATTSTAPAKKAPAKKAPAKKAASSKDAGKDGGSTPPAAGE